MHRSRLSGADPQRAAGVRGDVLQAPRATPAASGNLEVAVGAPAWVWRQGGGG